jgi:hypothetical protein
MNSYEARLVAFANGRRLLRLRYPVQNDNALACDACGSAEPRWLHLLKDEATGRFALVGGNCVRALTDLGAVRRRYAPEIAEQAYADERARRAVDQVLLTDAREDSVPEVCAPPAAPAEESGHGARLVAAVAVLQGEEWTTLLQTLPLGADRWRFIAFPDPASGMDDLVVIGVNGTVGDICETHHRDADRQAARRRS